MSRAIRRTADRAGRRARAPRLTACLTTAVVIAVLGAGTGTALAATVKPSASKALAPPAASTQSKTTVTTVPVPLDVLTQSLASVKVDQRFSDRLVAHGGRAPYSWRLSGGALPSGVSLSPGGLLFGETGTPGTDDISVEVTDSALPMPATVSQSLALIVTPARLHITTSLRCPKLRRGFSIAIS